MGARTKVALTYNYSENWIAGSYYIINLIKALNTLNERDKPHLTILYQKRDGLELIVEINYPYISFVNTDINQGGFITVFIKKLARRLTKSDLYLKYRLRNVHHIFEGSEEYPYIKNHYYWVHDFQEFRLPGFFSKEEFDERSALPRKVATKKDATLILSSFDALNDFKTFFLAYQCKIGVWRFASSLPEFSTVDFKKQSDQYNINKPYFICSNQFWQHKNHKVVLEAILLLKEKKLSFQVVFTGKNYDHRNPEYYNSLEKFVINNQLGEWTRFVGFIDRKVQLCLSNNAISYIQPSFFEGWSTTVEDAKYLNQYVLLSDIPVHREQLNYNVSFFNPSEPTDLASKMEEVLKGDLKPEKRDYQINIMNYGHDIIKTFLDNE